MGLRQDLYRCKESGWVVVVYFVFPMSKVRDDPRDASLAIPASLPPHWKSDGPGIHLMPIIFHVSYLLVRCFGWKWDDVWGPYYGHS